MAGNEGIRVSRNTIISHGGKHGQGGFYRAGEALEPDVAARVLPGIIASGQGKPSVIETPPIAKTEQAPAPATPPQAVQAPPKPKTPQKRNDGVPVTRTELEAMKRPELAKVCSLYGLEFAEAEPITTLQEKLANVLKL
jgi:hypothetical protein